MSRLRERYLSDVMPTLQKEFGYTNVMAVPRVSKVVVNMGVNDAKELRGMVVRVTGVGFFDVNHFQVGRSQSCIELHPILTIERAREDHVDQLR